MINHARECAVAIDFDLDKKANVYTFDPSTIDLYLSVFWWAEFCKTKGAIKLHAMLDVKTSTPSYINITTDSVHDVYILDQLKYESCGYYILDRDYLDFKRLYRIHHHEAYFVTRTISNTQLIECTYSKQIKKLGYLPTR